MWVEKTEMCGEFREINLGRWENLTAEEIREKYPEQYEERGRRIWMYRTPEGETFQEVADRFMSALNDIRKRCDEETNLGDGPDILAVAHAGVIRAYISRLTGRDGNRLLEIPSPYGGITELVDSGGDSIPIPVQIGWKPEEFLDEEAISNLYEKYHTPDPVIRHMKKVADFSEKIIEELTDMPEIHPERIRRACLLHDLCRQKKDHARISAAALLAEGYPEIADLVSVHHVSAYSKEEVGSPLSDAEVLFYADKRVKEDQVVTVQERFATSMAKCYTDEAVSRHENMLRKTLCIERKIQRSKGLSIIKC